MSSTPIFFIPVNVNPIHAAKTALTLLALFKRLPPGAPRLVRFRVQVTFTRSYRNDLDLQYTETAMISAKSTAYPSHRECRNLAPKEPYSNALSQHLSPSYPCSSPDQILRSSFSLALCLKAFYFTASPEEPHINLFNKPPGSSVGRA